MFKSFEYPRIVLLPRSFNSFAPLLERPAQATLTGSSISTSHYLLHILHDHLLCPPLLSDERPAPFLFSLVSLPSTLVLRKSFLSRANMSISVSSRHWVRNLSASAVATTLVTSQLMLRILRENIECIRRDCWCHGLHTAFGSLLMFSLYWTWSLSALSWRLSWGMATEPIFLPRPWFT